MVIGALGQETDDGQSDTGSCSCANPAPYMVVPDGAILLPRGLYPCRCRTCDRIIGVANPGGKLITSNKAAKGMTVAAPPNPVFK